MKAGMSLQEMAAEIQRQQEKKRDFKAPTSAITMLPPVPETEENDAVPLGLSVGKEIFAPNEIFHNQIGYWSKIPAKYYDHMLATAPELLVQNVNHWLAKTNETRLVRTLDGHARAFLSNKYRTIDNYMVAEAVLSFILERGNALGLRVESCDVSETRLYIKVVSEALSAPAVGDVVNAAVCISNSEVGLHSFRVEEMTMIRSCTNGAIRPDNSMRKYHVGRSNGDVDTAFEVFEDDTRRQSDKALMMQMRDVTRAAFNEERFLTFTQSITKIAGRKIERTAAETVASVVETFNIPLSLEGSILDMLAKKYTPTQWGLANAITEVAQSDAVTYEQSTDLERVGGQLLELPEARWNKLAVAAA